MKFVLKYRIELELNDTKSRFLIKLKSYYNWRK